MPAELRKVVIYTDGAAEPNPGPGGYGVVLIHGGHRKELSGGVRRSTNNRMELLAAVHGLRALKTLCEVTLYSDSRYLVDAMTSGAARKWEAREWWRNTREKVPNADLWEELLHLCATHRVEFRWLRGHAGIPENERCDVLAMDIVKRGQSGDLSLPADEGYEEQLARAIAETVPPGDAPGDRQKNPGAGAHGREKMLSPGQPCRKCGTPVEKRLPRKRESRGRRQYYFEYYLHCPGCKTFYMVEEARRYY
jgi:ribonuclease HI